MGDYEGLRPAGGAVILAAFSGMLLAPATSESLYASNLFVKESG
jgi:hypothetical protein